MIKGLTKNKILINVFLWIFIAYFSTAPTFALSTSPMPRSANVDEAMVNTYLRYGNYVPDLVIRSMGFRGTGFAVTPSNFEQIVSAVAAQWIFGISPKGIQNYSSDIVSDDQRTKAYNEKEANLLRTMGPSMMGVVPTMSNETFESDDSYEQGKIKSFKTGVTGIAMNPNINSTGSFVRFMGLAMGNRDRIAQATSNLNGALPEQRGAREIGKNSSSNGTSNSGSPFTGIGEIVTPASAKNAQLALTTGGGLNALAVTMNPDGGEIPVNTGKMPSNLGDAKAQKNVTSAQVTGTGEYAGTAAQVAGLTSSRPGSPIGDLSDINRIALENSANQINNRLNQLANVQNRYPNGRLNNLQNQFSPNDFNNQLANRFPSSGGGGGGGGGGNGGGGQTPTANPTTPSTTECDPTKAVLSQQEVVDVADFMGLPITTTPWTVSYFKAQQLIGQSVYLGNATSPIILGTNTISDTQACIWVTYAPSEKTGVFVSDIRSQTGTKFMFTMP